MEIFHPSHLPRDDHLSEAEVTEIAHQFQSLSRKEGCHVFWTGTGRELAQKWADQHDMRTLTTMMGPLMDPRHPSCRKASKSSTEWRKYIRGASGLFAEFARGDELVTVLTRPPPQIYSDREYSNYRNIDEPILKGFFGGRPLARSTTCIPRSKTLGMGHTKLGRGMSRGLGRQCTVILLRVEQIAALHSRDLTSRLSLTLSSKG